MTDQERDELIARVSNALDVPEPSPLFWEHFPDRVRAAVHAAPPSPVPWWKRRSILIALPAALALVVGTLAVMPRESVTDAPAPVIATTEVPAADDVEPIDEDPDWAAVASVAASAGLEVVREAGFAASPGSADAAIDQLDAEQRAELIAMLRSERKADGFDGL